MTEEFQVIQIDQVKESPNNPRRRFSEQGMQDLTDSIRKHGVLVPLLVRPVNGYYEIIAGARRYRAAKSAELEEIPVRIKEISDGEALEFSILENLQREDVHPLEEAFGYRALLDRPGYDVAAIAGKVTKSESYIYQRLKLIDLIKAIQETFLKDEITAGHAILIARLQPKDQEKALDACFDKYPMHGEEPVLMRVRHLASWIHQNIHLDLHAAPFSKMDPDLVPAAGACVTCLKRTDFMPQLFPDVAKKDTCTDPACFKMKLQAHIEIKKAEFQAKGQKLLEISTEYAPYGKKLKPSDPIDRDQYTEVSRKDRCESAAKAIVVDGYRDVGKVLEVCADKNCKKHFNRGYRRDPAEPARQKAKHVPRQKTKQVARQRTKLKLGQNIKACSKCGNIKNLDEFVKSKLCRDGHENTCLECRRLQSRKYQKQRRLDKISSPPNSESSMSDSKLVCKLCNAPASSEERLRSHMRDVHNKEL